MLPMPNQPGAFVFRARNTDRYYTATLDHRGRLTHLAPVANERRLAQFCANERTALPDPIPDADLVFDPRTLDSVCPASRQVNSYQPPPLLLDALQGDTPTWDVPPVISRLLDSLCGDAGEFREHLLNWLACLVQHRRPLGTAWVFHGCEGTGKRLFLRKVLQPLLGAQHVADWTMSELTGRRLLTEELARSCLLWVEGFAWHKTRRPDRLMQRLDQLISTPTLPPSGTQAMVEAPENHLNVILSASCPEPIELSTDDQRFILPPGQCRALKISTAELDAIDTELPTFACYLAHRAADPEEARRVPPSPAREAVTAEGGQLDAMFAALRSGHLEWFVALAEPEHGDSISLSTQQRFRRLVRQWCRDALAGSPTRVFNAQVDLVAAVLERGPYRRAAIRQSAQRYRIRSRSLWNPREQRSDRGFEVRFRVDDRPGVERFVAEATKHHRGVSA